MDNKENKLPFYIAVVDAHIPPVDMHWTIPIELTVALSVPSVIDALWIAPKNPTKVETGIYETRMYFKRTFITYDELSEFMSELKDFTERQLPPALAMVVATEDSSAHITMVKSFSTTAKSAIQKFGLGVLELTRYVTIDITPSETKAGDFTLTIKGPLENIDLNLLGIVPLFTVTDYGKYEIGYLVTKDEYSGFDDTCNQIAYSFFNAVVNSTLLSDNDALDENKEIVAMYSNHSTGIGNIASAAFKGLSDEIGEDAFNRVGSLEVSNSINVGDDNVTVEKYKLHIIVTHDLFTTEELVGSETSLVPEGKISIDHSLTINPTPDVLEKEVKGYLEVFITRLKAKLLNKL